MHTHALSRELLNIIAPSHSSTVYDKQYTANDKQIFAAMDCVQI